MGYVLIIISYVAMGGPKAATTPTIDSIPFASKESCELAKEWVEKQLNENTVYHQITCLPN